MSRQDWHEFVCAPHRAGRHLSPIGRNVEGAVSDSIDLDVLQSFLSSLADAEQEIPLLADAVDLLTGGYAGLVRDVLPDLLDSLSNETISTDDVVGPGLVGRPQWSRTLTERLSGRIPVTHFRSRVPERSFDLPENVALSWLLSDLQGAVLAVERAVGTKGLHERLDAIRRGCEEASAHEWLQTVPPADELTDDMIEAALDHRHHGYPIVASCARRRRELKADDEDQRLYNVTSLLAVGWLRPIKDETLYELFVLVLTMDILEVDLGFKEPLERGLVRRDRGRVASYGTDDATIDVFFNQAPVTFLPLGVPLRYRAMHEAHRGLDAGQRRPDVSLVVTRHGVRRLVVIEAKESADPHYVRDSVYKVFGYLHDYGEVFAAEGGVSAVLAIPNGVSLRDFSFQGSAVVVSTDDRTQMTRALRTAIDF